MNRVLRIDEEKPEMHISVQGYREHHDGGNSNQPW